MEAASDKGLLRPEAREAGVLYWLGLCQALMANLIERRMTKDEAERRISDMIMLGLTGLGVPEQASTSIAAVRAPTVRK